MDRFINTEPANAKRIINALHEFGFGSLGLCAGEFTEPDRAIQLGLPPVRIDIITSLSGVTWEETNAGKVAGSCSGVPVNFLGREQFIANKRATGRMKDLADIESLGEKPRGSGPE